MPKIGVNIGDGFVFEDDEITSNWKDSSIDGIDIKQNDGIYIPSLKGKDGSGVGTTVDGYTIIDNGNGTIQQNHSVLMNIFTMSAWKTVGVGYRSSGYIPYISPKACKTKSDVISEINFLFNQGDYYTSYNIQVGDLFQFVVDKDDDKAYYEYTFTNVATSPMEDGNRYVSQQTVALFVVDNITPRGDYVGAISDITLHCLWSHNYDWWRPGVNLT